MITAKARTDDYMVEVALDAEWWFRQADEDDILSLANGGWGGDWISDRIAIDQPEPRPADLDFLFNYLGVYRGSHKHSIGFSVYVDEQEAMEWLQEHRPTIAQAIQRELL